MHHKHLMLMGIQGSGKGTQAANICREFGFVSLETGAILRSVLEDPTHRHYAAVSETVPNGILTPNEVIFELIEDFFRTHAHDRILIDGAVRNIAQRQFFDAITRDYAVIHLELTEEEALSRLQGRKMDPVTKEIFGQDFTGMVNPKTGNTLTIRVDDQDKAKIQKRFEGFRSETLPLLDSWKNDGYEYYSLDGSKSRESVWNDIQDCIGL